MSESKSNESLIGTLEQSLRQTRKTQNDFVGQLKEVEAEAKRLEQEIEALEQAEKSIHSLLSRIRAGNHPSKLAENLRDENDYEILADVQNVVYRNQNNQDNQYYNNRDNQYSNNRDNYSNNREDQYLNNRDNPNNNRYSNDNYRDNPTGYINNQNRNNNRGGAGNSKIESISQRFADRTITQACTLLLRESAQPLHVNDLYKLLVAGGFHFKGNNPTISIAVSLNRNRRFEKIAPSTFDLVLRDASQNAA